MKTNRIVKVAAITIVAAGLMFVLSMPLWATYANKYSASVTTASVPETVRNLVDSKLVAPLYKRYYGEGDDRMMSRCPSGVHANYKSTEANQDGFYHGTVSNWIGCSKKEVCKFRANTTTVEVLEGDNFIAVAIWLKKPMAKQDKGEI